MVHKIKSTVLRAEGVKIEGVDKRRIEQRLDQIRREKDPNARLLSIPVVR